MTKKQIKILIITFIIVLLIVFVVFLLTNTKENMDNKEAGFVDVNELENKENTEIIKEPVIKKEIEVDQSELEIKSVARNFAERYGTWSTHNKEDNFKSAKIYATSRMKNIIEDFISNNEKLAEGYTDYYGVTTKALNAKILVSNETSANLVVSVQQIETSGEDLEKSTEYLDLNLELIKYNDKWLVDYAEWE